MTVHACVLDREVSKSCMIILYMCVCAAKIAFPNLKAGGSGGGGSAAVVGVG